MTVCVEYEKINSKKNGLKQIQCKYSEVKVGSWNDEEACQRKEFHWHCIINYPIT